MSHLVLILGLLLLVLWGHCRGLGLVVVPGEVQQSTFELCSLVGSLEKNTSRRRQRRRNPTKPSDGGHVTYVLGLIAGLEGHHGGTTGVLVANVLHFTKFLTNRGQSQKRLLLLLPLLLLLRMRLSLVYTFPSRERRSEPTPYVEHL